MLKGLLTQRNNISQNDLDSVASASLTTKCVSWESETCCWWLVEEAWTHNHTHWEEAWTHNHSLRSLSSHSRAEKIPELTVPHTKAWAHTHTEKNPEFTVPHAEAWAHTNTHWEEAWTHNPSHWNLSSHTLKRTLNSHSHWSLCSQSYAEENSELTLTHTEEPEFTPTHRD